MTSKQKSISLTLEQGEKIIIQNADSTDNLMKWIKSERSYWREILPQNHSDKATSAFMNKLEQKFNELENIISTFREHPEELHNTFSHQLRHSYAQHKELLYSGTTQAKAIETIKNEVGEDAASAALNAILNNAFNPTNFEQLSGLIAIANINSGLSNPPPHCCQKIFDRTIKTTQ